MQIPSSFRAAISCVALVLSFATGCDFEAQAADSTAAKGFWSPSSAKSFRGVQVDSLRAAIARRLATPRLGVLPRDTWRHVRTLYKVEGGSALWLGPRGFDRVRARVVIDAIATAGDHALRLEPYPLEPVRQALATLRASRRPTADQLADADVSVTALYVSLGEDLLTGQIMPSTVAQSWHIGRGEDQVDSTLTRTLKSANFAQALASLRPLDAGYDSLRRELVHYRALVHDGGWPLVPEGKNVAPRDSDSAERLTALRERLRVEGILAAGDRAPSATTTGRGRAVYDTALAGAVARFQERHAIVVDSILGKETVTSLNVPAEYRLGQIAANLERYRWLPHSFGMRYILVNVPEFQLRAFDGGKEALKMKVIVGADFENRATPVFSDSMEYVVFRPYWLVPDSIAAKEIWPKVDRDHGYLERNDYETFSENGEQHVRQKPGAKNALGLAKFMFPNEFNIYLHDTSESELFEKDVRAFSHGCIRVEHPDRLAQFVLGWSADSVHRQMDEGRDNHTVKLPQKIPVFIVYFTAYVRGAKLYFGNDLYDRDEAMVRAVGGGVAPSTEQLQALSAIRKLL
jgi:murein L,D-transpeptidase YcbB/YkuD